MKILLLGSGGREHAFAWKISQSPLCSQLFIGPGNAGTASCGTNVALSPNDFEAVGQFVLQEGIEMVVVGPEEPLVKGIYDYFQQGAFEGVAVIGPSGAAAQLEGSKAFAKAFMAEFKIPTAAYREFTIDQLEEGLAYIAKETPPIVLKADGLAAGKGVLICSSVEEAQAEFKAMLGGKFGEASAKVVIEEFLSGIEFSVFVATDGKGYAVLPIAKDYKRIGEGDTGLNTGGMGSVSPVSFVDEVLMQKVEEQIIKPTIKGIQERRLTYKGFVFIGLIVVKGAPYVIEYNCRMGDPETEVVFPRLQSDLVALLQAIHEERIGQFRIEKDPRAAAAIILVAGGYPEAYEKGKEITNIDKTEGSLIFHAGTRRDGASVVTNGGRVIAITSYGTNFKDALAISNRNAAIIQFEGKHFRKDIGFDL
ncbi:MAG: phosphoribosylamine--glycine ligase [Saprospiraceae bacterium]